MLNIKEVESASSFVSLRNAEDNTKDYLYICKYDETIRLSDKGTLIEFGRREDYSLGAVKIGTWHDGRPLYRKVYKVTTTINQDDEYVIDASSLEISEVVKFYGYARFAYTDDNNDVHTCCTPITGIVNYILDYYNPCGVYYDCTTGQLVIKSSVFKQLTYTEVVIEYIKGNPPEDEDNNNIVGGGGSVIVGPGPNPDFDF